MRKGQSMSREETRDELFEKINYFLSNHGKGRSWILMVLYIAKNHWQMREARDYRGEGLVIVEAEEESMRGGAGYGDDGKADNEGGEGGYGRYEDYEEEGTMAAEAGIEEAEEGRVAIVADVPEEERAEIEEIWRGLCEEDSIKAMWEEKGIWGELCEICRKAEDYFSYGEMAEEEMRWIVYCVMMRLQDERRRTQPVFYQDEELTELAVRLLGATEGTVYNPYAGACYYGMWLGKGVEYTGEVNDYEEGRSEGEFGYEGILRRDGNMVRGYMADNRLAYWLGRLNLLLKGRGRMVMTEGVGMEYGIKREEATGRTEVIFRMRPYDYIIATPQRVELDIPVGQYKMMGAQMYMPTDMEEEYLLASGRAARRKAVGVYSEKICKSGKVRELIDADVIETVIRMEEVYDRMGEGGAPRVIIVVNKEKARKGTVRFVEHGRGRDLLGVLSLTGGEAGGYVADVDEEEIRRNGYDITPREYIAGCHEPKREEGEEIREIGEIVEMVALEGKGRRIEAGDLSDDYLDCDIPSGGVRTEEGGGTTVCLLAGYEGGRLRVGKMKADGIGAAPGVMAFKIREGLVEEDYLLMRLTEESSSGQAMVRSRHSGTGMTEEAFRGIKIALPSREEQARRCGEEARQRAGELRARREAADFYKSFYKDLHTKRHVIGQSISAVSGWMTLLETVMEKNGGRIETGTTIGTRHKRTVGEIMANLSGSIKELGNQIFRMDRGSGMMRGRMDLGGFVREYIREHQSEAFEYEYMEPNEGKVEVMFAEEALQIIMDDIIENACLHGFGGREKAGHRDSAAAMEVPHGEERKGKSGNRIRVEIRREEGGAALLVSNNGAPLSRQLREGTDDVFTLGVTTREGHYGIGGYEVRTLMRQFGGEAEIVSTTEEPKPATRVMGKRTEDGATHSMRDARREVKYTVTYKLTFKDEI